MGKKKNLRKRYLIDRNFQLGYTAIIIALLVGASAISALAIAYLFFFVFDNRVACNQSQILFIQWICFVTVASIFLTIWCIRYTNRIVGPIKRATAVLKDASSGNLPSGPIEFRQNDMFKEFGQSLDMCLKTMASYKDQSNKKG